MPTEKFAEIIKSARNQKDFTQAQLAAEIGVSSAYISELENGKVPPPYPTTVLLAQPLGLNPEELWQVAQAERQEHKRRSDDRKKAAIQLALGKEELSGFEEEVLKKVRAIKKEEKPYILRFLNSLLSDES